MLQHNTTSPKKIRILITDDHTLLREAWKVILDSHPDFTVIAECGSGEEAIEAAKTLRPDVVLMDYNLPGITGAEATQQIRKYSPGSRIVSISQHTQPVYARKMLQAGALGYVTKNSSKDEMYTAIREVHGNKRYICTDIRNILSGQFVDEDDPSASINSLSARELEIIGYIKRGHTSKEIAGMLCVSSKTVEVHRYNIMKKLNVRNAALLVNFINREYPQ
ncbi:MAG TPA: response regulator transcription factor [Chitinophagaceae bacterium]|nr:response regulator transcription factor [Chitinophagaceae bacterium]